MDQAIVVSFILSVMTASTPLLLAATGELVTEKSGVLNLGVEGMMLVGAIVGFATTVHTGSALLGVLAGINAVLRLPGSLGGASLMFVLPVVSGAAFGARFGFLLGASSMAASALITGGVGPWLPFQMWALGWIGAGGAVARRFGEPPRADVSFGRTERSREERRTGCREGGGKSIAPKSSLQTCNKV